MLGERDSLNVDARQIRRSEEHTSEPQSLRHLVCRLLLEKKNATMTRDSAKLARSESQTHELQPPRPPRSPSLTSSRSGEAILSELLPNPSVFFFSVAPHRILPFSPVTLPSW